MGKSANKNNTNNERDSQKSQKPAASKFEFKKFEVKGMTCNSCVRNIEDTLMDIKGVDKVKVDFVREFAKVKYKKSLISEDKIKDSILNLGYSVDGEKSKRNQTFFQGLMYGIVPHIGCIAFLIGSVLGVSVLMQFFRPMLMSRYFFHFLVALSIGFATLSSAIYLKNNNLFSKAGIKRKWKYLTTMYTSTIGINMLLIFVIFPLTANAGSGDVDLSGTNSLLLSVDIPCSGHAPLIAEDLRSVNGVVQVRYLNLDKFSVAYDPNIATIDDIMSVEVFDPYPAVILEQSTEPGAVSFSGPDYENNDYSGNLNEFSCGAGCTGGCGGNCGGGCAGCGSSECFGNLRG